jgi:hypothetical protein
MWPSQEHATAARQPGDTILVIGQTWICAPHGTDVPALLAACQRTNTAGARASDPDTSHQAASENGKRAANDRRAVLEFHRAHPEGTTDFEMSALLARQQTSLGKRRGELRDLGLIEDTGLRRPAPSGALAAVWRITEAGRAAS